MKLLLIGKGSISDCIVKSENAESQAEIVVVGLRAFAVMTREEKVNLLSGNYARIFYLGYYRADLYQNLSLFWFVIRNLEKNRFKGELILASTQVTIMSNLCLDFSLRQRFFTYSAYFYIKKIQEQMLRFYNNRWLILHLPIVTGLDDAREGFFQNLAHLPNNGLPNDGKNGLYFLSADKLKEFILVEENIVKTDNSCERHLFLYSEFFELGNYLTLQFPKTYNEKDDSINLAHSNLALDRFVIKRFFREFAVICFHIMFRQGRAKAVVNNGPKGNNVRIEKLLKLPIESFIQYSARMSHPCDIKTSPEFEVNAL